MKFKSIKKSAIALVVVMVMLFSMTVTVFAEFDVSRLDAGYTNNAIVFSFTGDSAGNWASGWETKLYEYATGIDVTSKATVEYTNATDSLATVRVTWANENNRWYKIVVKDNTGKIRAITKSCAVDGTVFAPNTNYVSNINWFNSGKWVLAGRQNSSEIVSYNGSVSYTTQDSATSSLGYGGVYCSDQITEAGYSATDGTAVYTVTDVKAGEYTILYYNPKWTRTDVTVNINQSTTVTVNNGTPAGLDSKAGWVSLGNHTLVDGTNTIAFTKTNSGNYNRFYAGDMMIIPTSSGDQTQYAALDVYDAYWQSTDTNGTVVEIENFSGSETAFNAAIVYSAVNGMSEYTKADKSDVITALYDAQGVLIGAVSEELTLTPGRTYYGGSTTTGYKRSIASPNKVETTPIDLTKYPTAVKARVFIWDNAGELVPLGSAYDIDKKTTN